VHIHKTAGTSIQDLMLKYMNGIMINPAHIKAADIRMVNKEVRDNWNEYFTFAIVRNPWDRLVSWYFNVRHQHPNDKYAFYHPPNRYSFHEFITKYLSEKKCFGNDRVGYHCNQVDYLIKTPGSENLEFLVDFIGRFEALQSVIDHVCDQVECDRIKMIHSNKTPHRNKNYHSYYNDESMNVVNDIYSRDINYFGYEF